MKNKTTNLSRRNFLRGTAAASSAVVLQSLATGLPVSFLLNPSNASAQAMNRTVQTLIFSTSAAGDPVNVNCPGSYRNGVTNNPLLEGVRAAYGDGQVRGAAPWAELPANLRQRLAFFHHRTDSAAHPEHDLTMSFRGAIKNSTGNGQEMLPSMVAQLAQPHLNALQAEPMVLGRARITYQNQPLQRTSPTELKDLFAGQERELADLRTLRDRTLDRLYGDLKVNGSLAQRNFLDRFLLGRDQARTLGDQMGTLLDELPSDPNARDSARDQIIAAVALAKLGVTPAAVINIPFGRDNHQDETLEIERDQTISGVANIGFLWSELRRYNLHNQVTFAMLNVFGRTLNRNFRGGRDHNRHHGVMVAFGANVKGGVYGGVDTNGRCRRINPNNGRATNNGGIAEGDTLGTAGKSLLAAMGHTRAEIDDRIRRGQILAPFIA